MKKNRLKRELRREMNDAYSAIKQVHERIDNNAEAIPITIRDDFHDAMASFELVLLRLRKWWK